MLYVSDFQNYATFNFVATFIIFLIDSVIAWVNCPSKHANYEKLKLIYINRWRILCKYTKQCINLLSDIERWIISPFHPVMQARRGLSPTSLQFGNQSARHKFRIKVTMNLKWEQKWSKNCKNFQTLPEPNGHLMCPVVTPRSHFVDRNFQIFLMQAIVPFPRTAFIAITLLRHGPSDLSL